MFCCGFSRWSKLKNNENPPPLEQNTRLTVQLSVPEACREMQRFQSYHTQFFTQGPTNFGRVFLLDLALETRRAALLSLKSNAFSPSHDHCEIRIVNDGDQFFISGNIALSNLVFFKGKYNIVDVTQDRTTRALSFRLKVVEDSALKFLAGNATKELSAGQELVTFTIIPSSKKG